MEHVALLGYGRLGRTLGELLARADIPFRAHDPHVAVPPERHADSPEALVAGAGLVVLAVPVLALADVAARLRPHLSSAQLVLDVGSVKVRAVEALAAVLGREVPWVGTHPLFGPDTLARGERPLRAVVCPNPLHPEAAARARGFYERLGCEVLEQTADAHDAVMARTHALTRFLARGLLEVGVQPDSPFVPPSFAPFLHLLATARVEPPHLLATIQAENPYAREVRERLLETLLRLHRELEEAPSSPPPATPPVPPALAGARAELEGLDRALVELLQRRAALARRAEQAGAAEELPVVDAAREARMLTERRAWAEALGLDPEGVEDVFRALLRLSRRMLREGR